MIGIGGSPIADEGNVNQDQTTEEQSKKDESGNRDRDEENNTQSKDKKESKNDSVNYSVYENSIIMNMVKPAWDYASKNNIDLPNFIERKEVLNVLTTNNINSILSKSIHVEMEEKEHFKMVRGSYEYYKKTLDNTNTLYYGNLNSDSEPEGLGVVFQLYDEYTDEPIPLVKYVGYFDSGKYDGYGIEFEIYESDEIPNIVDMEILLKNSTLFNTNDFYEGYYKDGDRSGDGVNYISNLYENLMIYSGKEEINSNDLIYSYTIAEYSKNTINGYSKEYMGNKLYYEGEQKEDEFHGYGKLYNLDTGNLEYEGEFSHGKYHGKGTLYDESGNVLHKGEFVVGDIK